jgi:O-antigen/teichoic acid export membrane protein
MYKIFFYKLGINEVIAYTIFSRIIQVIGGIISIIFISKYLTKVEQGYYYTFGSILAIQIFFELGLSNIITQFVAHENASLKWSNKFSFSGPIEICSRLSSLLRFSIKWFAIISILLLIGLIITGYIFFGKFGKVEPAINWQIPWIILTLTTSLSLMLSPISAFIEGLGRVEEVAKIRLFQQIIQLTLNILFFTLGQKLYSIPLAAIISFCIIPIWIYTSDIKKTLIFIWNKIDKYVVNYKSEIFPYQWKIALSWISGYFIFQLFNPVLFATEGPVIAGQMGMTLVVLNNILMFTLSWISTKTPIFSNLIAKKNYSELDRLFNRTLIQSTLINIFGLLVFLLLVSALKYFNLEIGDRKYADRFLPTLPMILMMIPILLNHIISSWATYLRCHKKEPMLVQSITIGLLSSISTLITGKYFGLIGMTLGYFIVTIISFIWTYLIYKKKKEKWHYEY